MSQTPLATAKQYLRINNTAQDLVVQLSLDAAEEFLSQYLGCDFSQAQHTENLDGGGMFLLPHHRPLVSIDTVNPAGTLTAPLGWVQDTFVTEFYIAEIQGQSGLGVEVAWVNANGLPMGRWIQGLARYQLKYTAGLSAMPSAVQMAVLKLVARDYEQRTGQTQSESHGQASDWGKLLDSDILKSLSTYSYRRLCDVAPDQDGFGASRPRLIY